MSIWKKYQSIWISLVLLVSVLILLFVLGEIFLPFILALLLAYLINPLIVKIQRVIPNRNLSVTAFLFFCVLLLIGTLVFLGSYIKEDATRFVNAVEIFTDEHQESINEFKGQVTQLFGEVSESEFVQEQLSAMQDSTVQEDAKATLSESLSSVYTLFQGSDEKAVEKKGINGFVAFIYLFIYLIPILYTYDYFDGKFKKYFGADEKLNSHLTLIWTDFKNVFLDYFRQRSKIVLICTLVFIATFTIMGLPGAIILGVIAGLLTYATHFHYLSLLPISIGCWILSMEQDLSFFLFFGIILGVFILISILDEMVFFPRIMKNVAGMNPAIMILAFTLWIFVFGGFIGTLIALPLTSLLLIYLDRFLLYSVDNPSYIRTKLLREDSPVEGQGEEGE